MTRRIVPQRPRGDSQDKQKGGRTMALSKAKVQELVTKFGKSGNDTGSTEVQVALLTEQINTLSEHLVKHPKDFHSKHGLLLMVGKRRSLLNYLEKINYNRYQQVIKDLKIRK